MKSLINGKLVDTPEREPFESFVPPPNTKLFKSTFIRRMTPSEATFFEGVLASEEAYLRMLYHSVEWFDMADALVGYLHMTLAEHAGEARANELLAPE